VLAGDRQRCMQAGMDEVLTKPIDSAKLRSAVAVWLEPAAGATRAAG
jgi:CheY-like chemotaxis protein